MRFGVNTWVWTSPLTTDDFARMAPLAVRLGFDWIEVPLENLDDLDPRQGADIARAYGLGVSCCAAMGPDRDLIHPDSAIRDNGMALPAQGRGGRLAGRAGRRWRQVPADAAGLKRAPLQKEIRMPRPITLFTGQWADLTLDTICAKAKNFGYDGLELACWGDHFEVDKALSDDGYVKSRWDILNKHGLKCFAISNHLVGQAVCDLNIDERHKGILPSRLWGDGDPEGVRQRAAQEMKDTARAAAKFGVKVVNGFTGSKIWHTLAMFPPVPAAMIDDGYKDFADRWNPILDVFDQEGVKFALEVHPGEIAYDFWTTQRALEAVNHRSAFGINIDPSHLNWQMVDPVGFIYEFRERIYHMHVKESVRVLDGRNGILSSHLFFGDHRRGWDFVSPGRGSVPFERVFRALNDIGFSGSFSVEWEDNGMNRDQGAPEALEMVRRLDLTPSNVAFDAAFASKK